MKNQKFTEKQKSEIFLHKENNLTWKYIGRLMKCNPDSIRRLYYREKNVMGLPPKIKVPKTLITGRMAKIIKDIVKEKPQISNRKLPAEVRSKIGDDRELPSYKSMERFLKESGFVRKKLIKKPFISENNRIKRLEFAKNNREKGPDFWDNVIWTDETMVRSLPNCKERFHRVHNSVKRENMPFNHQVQNGGFGVMFWGCFSKSGLGPLIAIEGNLNSESYLNLLKNQVLPNIRRSNPNFTFMHDNAPCHASRAVKAFLDQEGVRTLKWPAQSPDLNPIENLWAIIKRRLVSEFPPPTNRNQLIANTTAIWNSISPQTCVNLADSIINRLNAVILKNGKQTNY